MSGPSGHPARRSRLLGTSLLSATFQTLGVGLWLLLSRHFGWFEGDYTPAGLLVWIFLAYFLGHRSGRRAANRDSDRVIAAFAQQAGVIR